MKNVATIPAHQCFVTTLAHGLWQRANGDPLALSRMIVFLPTRRAARHLREAFLRVTNARAALLPRMKPLGDVDEIDLDFAGSQFLDNVPPSIGVLRRQMLLARAIRMKDKSIPLDQAASLAKALGDLLDQVQTEGLSFDDLHKLVPENYSKHWQETLRFLEIITHAWPSILQEEGCIDPATRRNLVFEAQARLWLAAPPEDPVIAAGSTGSVPAAARLMKVIAELPKGEVILPGLDTALDGQAWEAISETHPQYTMKQWLHAAGIDRRDVRCWDGSEDVNAPRINLLREVMRPAEVTQEWQRLSPLTLPAESFAGIERLECEHHREEADVIALRLRVVLEEEGKTAALITPDRTLGARVAAALGRWGIVADDSAGAPLGAWPVGSFLAHVLQAADKDASPVDFLALLKHPLAATGLEPAACRQNARLVERKIWRGVRLAGGWSGAAKALKKDAPEAASWLKQLGELFKPLSKEWKKELPVTVWMDRHLALAEALTCTPTQTGAARLWSGDAGEAAVAWLDEWRQAVQDFPPIRGAAYAALFLALMDGVTVRPAYGQHPRLSILGPLEARLLHHDVVILGGLNEGTWPPAPAIDPWLSRPMKRDFGLPVPERRVGQSAHDFVQLACARHVVLSRARRVGGSPTVPSRFLLQLDTVLQAAGHQTDDRAALMPRLPWQAWARRLDEPKETITMSPPSPCPPVDQRPTSLRVTEISTWLRNPYAIYARHILKLDKLDDIDADVTAAEHGTAIHAALENFVKQTLESWPSDPLALLLEEGRKAFAPYIDRPQVNAFWWPRFEKIAQWFVRHEQERRVLGIMPLAVECLGTMAFANGALVLRGRADRVDRLADGRVEVIDYKTGGVPKKGDVMAGLEPQLALLALMVQGGAFENVKAAQVGALSYWKPQEKSDKKKITKFTEDLGGQCEKAKEGLERLQAAFANPSTPYEAVPKPQISPRYDDYAHLARLAEWGRVQGGGE